ncbi:hypothetical protein [Shimia sediminis]|uniref:hypothetical protein n=1 Tax=Shimia sediminis TaxID=2497945 RepID=UPI000F8F6FF9|nr:hypothetical protein [Shimia sediminis]
MSKFTAPLGGSPLDEDVAEVRHQLKSLRGGLALLRDKLEQDEDIAGGPFGKVLMELRQLLRTTMETEQKLEERRKKKEGIVHDYRLDLEDARTSIGRRLDRLRAAEDARGFSGRVE